MVNETIDTSEDFPIKIVVVGEESVGKTAICQSLCNPSENVGQEYYPTMGMDIYRKRIIAGSRAAQLQVMDVSGLALKSRYLVNLVHGSDAILFVYDITNMGSLQKAEEWIKCIRTLYKADEASRIPIQKRLPLLALVGHKGKSCAHFLSAKY
jgi:GTPase SAR1 family protein